MLQLGPKYFLLLPFLKKHMPWIVLHRCYQCYLKSLLCCTSFGSERDRASSEPKLCFLSTPVLTLSSRLTHPFPELLTNEAGRSPRSMLTGESSGEACFLTCSFLLPFLGRQIPAPPTKKEESYSPCAQKQEYREQLCFNPCVFGHCLGDLLRDF